MEEYMRELVQRKQHKVPNILWNSFCDPQQSSTVKIVSQHNVEKRRNIFTTVTNPEHYYNNEKASLKLMSNFQIDDYVDEAQQEVFNNTNHNNEANVVFGSLLETQKKNDQVTDDIFEQVSETGLSYKSSSNASSVGKHLQYFPEMNTNFEHERVNKLIDDKVQEHKDLPKIDNKANFNENADILRTAVENFHGDEFEEEIEETPYIEGKEASIMKQNSDEMEPKKALPVKQGVPRTNIEANEFSADEHYILMKVTQVQEKSYVILLEILKNLQTFQPIDDEVELEKRKKRAEEFATRFARNHLYQIGRLIQDIKISRNPGDIINKTMSLFNTVFQALNSYVKNMKNFIYNCVPEKLIVLIDFLLNSVTVCNERKIFSADDVVNNMVMTICLDILQFLKAAKTFNIPHKLKRTEKVKNTNATTKHINKSLAKTKNPYENSYNHYQKTIKKKSQKQLVHKSHENRDQEIVDSCNAMEGSKVKHQRNVKKNRPLTDDKVRTAIEEIKPEEGYSLIENLKICESNILPDESIHNSKFKEAILEIIKVVTKQQLHEVFKPVLGEVIRLLQSEKPTSENERRSILSRLNNLVAPSSSERSNSTNEKCFDQHNKNSKIQDRDIATQCCDAVHRIGGCMDAKVGEKNVIQNDMDNNIKHDERSNKTENTADGGKLSNSSVLFKQKNVLLLSLTEAVSSGAQQPLNNQQVSKPANDLRTETIDRNRQQEIIRKFKSDVMNEKLHVMENFSRRSLYGNENFERPWNVISRAADALATEQITCVAKEGFDQTEIIFIREFLLKEMKLL